MLWQSDVQKALAGDRRAGWSARRTVRENHRRVFRKQWRLLLCAAAVLVAVTVVAAIFTPGDQARGFVLGSGLTATACALAGWVVLISGTAPTMMGELAEQWTAQELRPLTGHGWRLVNHFGLSKGDHDHVLVGPGGIVLVESKWSAHEWELTDRDHFFQAALAQTARNAKQLASWHEIARHGRPHVEPVLVLWGQARSRIAERPPGRHERTGVLVTAGDHVQTWVLRQSRALLTPTQVQEIWSSLVKHAGRRDELEQRAQPMPRSLSRQPQRQAHEAGSRRVAPRTGARGAGNDSVDRLQRVARDGIRTHDRYAPSPTHGTHTGEYGRARQHGQP